MPAGNETNPRYRIHSFEQRSQAGHSLCLTIGRIGTAFRANVKRDFLGDTLCGSALPIFDGVETEHCPTKRST